MALRRRPAPAQSGPLAARREFLVPPSGHRSVVTLADAADEGAIGFQTGEISASSATESLVEADLDMAVGGLDAAVLVGEAGIVAGGLHAVVPT